MNEEIIIDVVEIRKGFIYKITSPSGRVYIGATVQEINERWRAYKRLNCSKQPKIFNSLKKYGPENHIFEIIEEYEMDTLLKRETFWKKHYLNEVNGDWSKVLFCRLDDSEINEEIIKKLHECSLGEKNHFYGKKHTEETKEKLRQIQTGKKHTEESKKKMSESRKGEKSYLYGKKGELHPCFGKKQSEESIKKRTEGRKGKKISKEIVDKFSHKVIINDIEYPSIAEASRQLSINNKIIRARLKNTNFPNYQYSESAKNKRKEKVNEISIVPIDIRVGVLIEGIIYTSIAEASKQLNLKYSTLVNRLESDNFPNYHLLKKDNKKKNIKKIGIIIDNINYDSLKEASLILRINQSTIRWRIKSLNFPNYKKL